MFQALNWLSGHPVDLLQFDSLTCAGGPKIVQSTPGAASKQQVEGTNHFFCPDDRTINNATCLPSLSQKGTAFSHSG